MRLVDVNVLLYGFRQDAPGLRSYAAWLNRLVNSDAAYGVSDLILSGFLAWSPTPDLHPTHADAGRAGLRSGDPFSSLGGSRDAVPATLGNLRPTLP